MFVYRWIWSGLKKLLVREGRAGRQDFALKGLLPLWLTLFALLSVPAFPKLGDLGLALVIAAIFFSRVAIAMAVRRAHDLGVEGTDLTSFRRQSLAYFQIFVVMVFTTTFVGASMGNLATPLILAAVAAGAMVCILLGGSKIVVMLTTRMGEVLPNAHGVATAETIKELKALADKPDMEALRKVLPREAAHPLQSKVRPAAKTEALPESTPRTRPVYKTKADPQPARAQDFPQHPKPIVRKRKRGAIGEWN
jgi:uncharacterized membrane protein YhaH (DUF805 family)